MHFSLVLFLLVLPLGLDTLGVSLSLGIKSQAGPSETRSAKLRSLPLWLRTALLFALAETLMPIVGLLIGAALSTLISDVMHYVGALLLVGLGAWELVEEGREYLRKRRKLEADISKPTATAPASPAPFKMTPKRFLWGQQLLLALSISMDELAVGFSFGSLKSVVLNPALFCLLVGLQGFLMTLLGLTLGRSLRTRLKVFKEVSELLSAALLIGLGVWFFFS